LKTKPIESFWKVIPFINTSKVKNKLRLNTASIYIKVVSFPEIPSELSISRMLMCRHAVELTAITHLK
jgi:hypothetical protein